MHVHPGWPRNEPNLHTQTGFPEVTALSSLRLDFLYEWELFGLVQYMIFTNLIFSTG